MTSQGLALLMALRVQGTSTPKRLATALGVDESSADHLAHSFVQSGTVEYREAPVAGFMLTSQGHQLLDQSLEDEGLKANEELKGLYDRFEPLNSAFMQIATDWQTYRRGGVEVRNDHSDGDYDQAVIDRLRRLHDATGALLKKLEGTSSRFAHYLPRLEACVERLLEGDLSALTGVLKESYHTVWFEFHEDLMLTLGIARTE